MSFDNEKEKIQPIDDLMWMKDFSDKLKNLEKDIISSKKKKKKKENVNETTDKEKELKEFVVNTYQSLVERMWLGLSISETKAELQWLNMSIEMNSALRKIESEILTQQTNKEINIENIRQKDKEDEPKNKRKIDTTKASELKQSSEKDSPELLDQVRQNRQQAAQRVEDILTNTANESGLLWNIARRLQKRVQ